MNTPENDLVFHDIAHNDKHILEAINSQFTPYADTAYGTLKTWWSLYETPQIALINGNAVVKSSYPVEGAKKVYSIIGAANADKTLDDMMQYLASKEEEACLYYVPHYFITSIKQNDNYLVELDDSSSEYVLSTENYSSLSDKGMLKIRHKVNAFINANPNVAHRLLDIENEKHLIIDYIHRWKSSTAKTRDDLEELIIQKTLDNYTEIDIKCLGLTVDEELIGVILYKHLPNGFVNVNHVKVNYYYKNIFVYALHLLAKSCLDQGIEYLNIEQDLGIDGLRTFKQRLHPTMMLEKYTIKKI